MKLDARSPVCKPLYTYEEVVAWQPDGEDLPVIKTPWSPRQRIRGAKTLICHDMRGGYLEDRLVQGCPKSDCYRFYHWQFVDTFVYFSHHFVTIPPPTWIIPAHRHGVKVLGTVITEWDDGKRRCEAVLESEETYKRFVDKLVQIAHYYGFDGWLVNIENVIKDWDQVQKLQGFVGYLTEQQHNHDPTSEVIWYDSVINTGQLQWQDELNEKNRMFFDVCDGIFLNYCWKDENLSKSKDLAVSAGRPYDVYVGVDVFGRGCLGGGGYNTCEALGVINKHDLSAALFANGWVYEKLGEEHFVQNENKFWKCLDEFCFSRHLSQLPLVTTFCQGQGQHYWSEGKVLMDAWYNQSIQQLQPSYTAVQLAKEEFAPFSPVMEHYMQEAYTGGNCIKLGGKLAKGQSLSFKLFSLDVDMNSFCQAVPEGTPVLYVSFTYICKQNEDSGLCVQLLLNRQIGSSEKKAKKTGVIFLTTSEDSFHTGVPNVADNDDARVVGNKNVSDVPSYIRHVDSSGWKTSYFELHAETVKDARLTELAAVLTSHSKEAKNTTVLLGEIRVIPAERIADDFPMLVFGETTYHDPQPLPQYINAENSEVERGITNIGNENRETEDIKGLCNQTTHTDKVQMSSGDTVHIQSGETAQMKSQNTVQMQSIDTFHLKTFDTVQMKSIDTMDMKSHDTVRMASSDQLNLLRSETVQMTDSDGVYPQRSETVQMTGGDSFYPLRSETIQMTDSKANIQRSMECFTLHWRVSNPEKVQYYRVYQVMRPSDGLKLLGLTIFQCFKVTGFTLSPIDVSQSGAALNSTIVSAHTEAEFKCVIQPVLNTGNPVPLNVCKSNIKSESFGLESIVPF